MRLERWAILLALAVGCRCGTLSHEEFEAIYPLGQMNTIEPRKLREVVDDLRDSAGTPTMVTGLRFSPNSASLTARDPRNPKNYDVINWYDGRLTKTPERMSSGDEERRAKELFDLATVPLDAITASAHRALKELKVDQGKVISVAVDLDSDKGALTIEVSLEGPRERGRVKFDAKGAVLSAKLD